jgi:hypothetical protein
MRTVMLFIFAGLYTLTCHGQNDSTRKTEGPTPSQVIIPGVDAPVSAPGTLMQSSTQSNAVATPAQSDRKRRRVRTAPPSDPRAFGVAIPIGEPKKDTIRSQK